MMKNLFALLSNFVLRMQSTKVGDKFYVDN